jgi:hypothetical protein
MGIPLKNIVEPASMPVDTKTVPGRRELVFRSLDEVVADAETLVASPNTKMLGNWPLSIGPGFTYVTPNCISALPFPADRPAL